MTRVNPVGLTIRHLLRFVHLTTQRLKIDYPIDAASIRNAVDTLRLIARFENEFRRSRQALEEAILNRPEYKDMLFKQHARDQGQEQEEQTERPAP